MESKWNMYAKKADFARLAETYHIDPVVARIMVNRDISEDEMEQYLKPSLEDLHDPHLLKDVDLSVELLMKAVKDGSKIRIIGDYDIDGINSTYILHQALIRVGADVDYAIPHRMEDGYGINESMVEKAYEAGVKLIITCDNGIAARSAIATAKLHDMTVIVTDHHAIPYEEVNGERIEVLPEADAIVNPHQSDCRYPFPEICGAVVAWKLVFVLFERAGLGAEVAYDYLGNAAFATVGDIMPLRDENRSIVKLGLRAIAGTKNPGLNALIERLQIDRNNLSTYHLGFLMGPCFNASGRLDTAVDAIELMEEIDSARAISRAAELVNMNEERKALTRIGDEKAFDLIESQNMAEDDVLIVYIPELHESLAGIVAGHIKERYFKPTFVFTDAKDGGLKGSGRSIPAYSMYDKLHECQEFLSKYGGHPMAAGVSLPKENLEAFRRKMNQLANLTEDDKTPVIHIDVPMPLAYVSEELIHELDLLEPFGNGNEKPVFAVKHMPIKRISYMGKENQYLRIIFRIEDGREMTGLYFRGSEELEAEIREVYGDLAWENAMRGQANDIYLTITYFPQINEYRGNISLQALITGVKTDKIKNNR